MYETRVITDTLKDFSDVSGQTIIMTNLSLFLTPNPLGMLLELSKMQLTLNKSKTWTNTLAFYLVLVGEN